MTNVTIEIPADHIPALLAGLEIAADTKASEGRDVAEAVLRELRIYIRQQLQRKGAI